MIKRPTDIQLEPVAGEVLDSVIAEFMAGDARRKKLRDAYANNRSILKRTRMSGQPNNRLAHGFARYIAIMASGYLIGNPVEYQCPDGQEAAMDAVTDAYRQTDAQSVDIEIARNASVYGVGCELIYADGSARPRSAAVEPEQAFVVYDDTVAKRPLFGVYIVAKRKGDGSEDGYCVEVYTASSVYGYRIGKIGDIKNASPVTAAPHFFARVPMIEYWNNDSESGDFEQVDSLIDAYDVLQSDRVNDKEQFVDSMIVLSGVRMEPDAAGRTPGQQLREDKILVLPDADCTATYLSKSLTESDIEVLKDALKADIHKFSLVPDLTDEQFAGNASGVAMRYKLLGLEQLVRGKERWFREALRERLRCYAAFLAVKGAPVLDADGVSMTFKRFLPANEVEISQMVQTYAGLVPDEMLLAQVPFIEDVGDALDKLAAQKDEAIRRQQKQFGMSADMDDA